MNETLIPMQLNHRDIDRIKGYKELLDFYHGRHWEGRAARGEKRLTFNYAKVFIDKVTSYLMSGINFAVDAIEDSDAARVRAQAAEAALFQVYEQNNLEQLDFDTEIDCAILGDACYKVMWEAESQSIRITTPDIQGIYAWWLGDDTSRVWRVASKYCLSAEETELLYRVKPKGKTATVVELWTDREFELYLDNAPVEKKPNPYGFIPFVIYPNLREPKKFWGISDLPQIMEAQRELNRVQVEGYDPVITVNGHSYANHRSGNTNFALLMSTTFTKPFREPIAYGKYLARLANILSGGVLVQRLGDLTAGQRSTPARIERGLIQPTLKSATPGDLSFVLPYRHLTGIMEMLQAMDKLVPGVASPHTLLYGVEVKFYSCRPQLSPTWRPRLVICSPLVTELVLAVA